jgi:precorrin-6B methylase 2
MKQELAAVSVTDSRPAVADLSLNVGAATQTVTVEAASNQISVERKTNAKPESSSQAAPVFEIITDNGDHWTSADGIAWKRM